MSAKFKKKTKKSGDVLKLRLNQQQQQQKQQARSDSNVA